MRKGMLILFLPLLAASSLLASGFNIYEFGGRGSGMAGALVARPWDASTLFYNPSGLAFLRGTQFYGGTTLIFPNSHFVGAYPIFTNEAQETVVESEIVFRKITQALKSGRLAKDTTEKLVAKAVESGVIDHEEARILARAEEARNDAIQVDSFTLQEFAVTTPKRKVAKESAADMALAV